MRVVKTDNFDADSFTEEFETPEMFESDARLHARKMNEIYGGDHEPYFWKVVPNDYELNQGFEP